MTKKKMKQLERDLSKAKHTLDLVRTIVPIVVLVLQVVILGRGI